MKKRVLTGITTTGTPHLGNYVGAIRPAIAASKNPDILSFYFLADYHALIKCHDPERIHQSTLELAATWLACGLDPDKVIFYRQSDIPEIPELSWILTCMTAKGLMNRAHAYKACVDQNQIEKSKDPDKGISMGLFSYPILMAADILMFKASTVPVGKDQIQHLEMARDIAARFNHHFGELFVLPEAEVDEKCAVLAGLDGRKMSKSYNNTVPLFVPEKKLRKLLMKIKTDSLPPEAPKDPATSSIFEMYCAFAGKEEQETMKNRYQTGIGWGKAKEELFEKINAELEGLRSRYEDLVQQPEKIEDILQQGAKKARQLSRPFLQEIRQAVGLKALKYS